MTNIFAIIVIYNKNCKDSVTCRCLSSISGINVIIADNSTVDCGNADFAAAAGWTYVDMDGNKGLSKAYNRAIEAISDLNALICLFDDDTEVGPDYFDCLINKANEEPETKIFLPHIYGEAGLMSPNVFNGVAARRVDNVADIPPGCITGINSGMAIRRSVFIGYRYDEGYFLDYIDHAFLRDMKRLGNRITVFDACLNHHMFFENPDIDLDALIKRFKVFKKDFKRFCGTSLKSRYAYFKEMFFLKKALYLKHNKSLRIFFT
ncbi:MAG: glycosyltransferase [Christensenellales bacterium]